MRNETATGTTGLDLGAFMRALAHEIANPLNAIALNAELVKLLLERRKGTQARATLEHLLAECERCEHLLQGLRRFGDGLQAHPREIMSTRILITAAIDLVRLERKDVPAIEVDPADAQICVDRLALQQAFAALMHNAADAGADSLHIATCRKADAVSIDIVDNGSGIPANLRDKVFEPFFSTRRAQGGSGMGLALAQALVRAHGGDVRIAAAERGTRVSVTLPALPIAVDPR